MDDPEKWFTELYDEHHRRVFAYALASAGRDVAEDVASETFLIAWRRLDHVPDTPLPWLLGVARNLLHQQRDGGNRRRALAERVAALTAPEDLSVWDVADHVIQRDSALAAIASLSERDLELLTLVMWHGLSPGDAAKLPTSASQLRAELERRWQADRTGKDANPDGFTLYAWSTAADLLAGPITPGTKAALYRVLAGLPGIRNAGAVKDRLGRPGTALAMPSSDGESRVVDQRSGEFLAYESWAKGARYPRLSDAYRSMGWVGGLSDRL